MQHHNSKVTLLRSSGNQLQDSQVSDADLILHINEVSGLDVENMLGDVVLQNTAALETDRINTRKTDRASEASDRRGLIHTSNKSKKISI